MDRSEIVLRKGQVVVFIKDTDKLNHYLHSGDSEAFFDELESVEKSDQIGWNRGYKVTITFEVD